jgi:putative acetyltransferase
MINPSEMSGEMMLENLDIRESLPEELAAVLAVERAAFGSGEEVRLVMDLLKDPSAEPVLSLLALFDTQAVGHILFTKAVLDPPIALKAYILAPLAVIPAFQKQGIGGSLIKQGLQILADWGVDWVFVLGHESYYPRHGFSPALKLGFEPPYPIPEQFTGAWMTQALTPNCSANYRGRVIPAQTLNQPQYWGE